MKLSNLLSIFVKELQSVKVRINDTIEFFRSPSLKFEGYRRVYGKIENGESIPLFKDEQKVSYSPLDILHDLAIPLSRSMEFEIALDQALTQFPESVNLEVDGISLGEFSALELKSIYKTLTNEQLGTMYANLPVRLFADTVWTPGYAEGLYEIKDAMLVLPFGSSSPPLPNIILLPEGEDSHLRNAKMIDYQVYSTALPAGYKKQILERRDKIIKAIESLLNNISLEIRSDEMKGRKILNYIHFGDPQGMEHYPY